MCAQYEATKQWTQDAVGYGGLVPEGRERCWPYQHLFAVCLLHSSFLPSVRALYSHKEARLKSWKRKCKTGRVRKKVKEREA